MTEDVAIRERERETGSTDLKMGQCAELSQWKPLFFCPVSMSQMMMACGSSLVSISGLKVTTYLKHNTMNRMCTITGCVCAEHPGRGVEAAYLSHGEKSMRETP